MSSPSDLLKRAAAVCRRRGYNLRDTEYESAVNYAVAVAIVTHDPARGRTLGSWACFLALRECSKVARAARCSVLDEVEAPAPPSYHPLVSACAGRTRREVASELGVSVRRLRDMLDEAAMG